ncbi:MAG: tetratricopeptide repeat protein, partial [Verrucomicrobiota bacterium]
QAQTETVNRLIKRGEKGIDARKRLALYLFTAGDTQAALIVLQQIEPLAPDDIEIPENIGVMLRKLRRDEEAIEYLLRVHERAPDRANICDALAHTYYSLRESDRMIHFGRLSLELKDAEAAACTPVCDIPKKDPPAFDPADRAKNVIAFSLWGRNPRYLAGALRNATVARDIYPSWTCRFYCDDSVPPGIRDRLVEYGAEVVMRPTPESFFDGLLWRFEVASDPAVRHFAVRDCDSVVNVRERVAVEAWLNSGKWFHAMRDFPSHTEVILAGMWGGVSGVLPSVPEMKENFHPTIAPTMTFDQMLLREVVWPTLRQSVLIHDSVYTGCLGSVPFPEGAVLPPDRHVGQNEAAVGGPMRNTLMGRNNRLTRSAIWIVGSDPTAAALISEWLAPLSPIARLEEKSTTMVSATAAAVAEELGDDSRVGELLCAKVEGMLEALASDRHSHLLLEGEPIAGAIEALIRDVAGFRLAFVARDPRQAYADTIDLAGENDPIEAQAFAEQWVEAMERLQGWYGIAKGRIELFRYEDFEGSAASSTVARLLSFVGLPSGESAIESFLERSPELAPARELDSSDTETIEHGAGSWIRKLKYPMRAAEPSLT